MKRIAALVTTLVLVLGAAVAIAPAALADKGSCTVNLSGIGARYSIDGTPPVVRVGGTCILADNSFIHFHSHPTSGTGEADLGYWVCNAQFYDPATSECESATPGIGEYRENTTQPFRIIKAGTWKVRLFDYLVEDYPGGSANQYTATFPKGSITTVAKLATETRLSVHRRNRVVHFSVDSLHWSTRDSHFVETPGAVVQIQQKSGTRWRIIHTVHLTCANGCSTDWKTPRAQKHIYRAVSLATETRWGSHSQSKTA